MEGGAGRAGNGSAPHPSPALRPLGWARNFWGLVGEVVLTEEVLQRGRFAPLGTYSCTSLERWARCPSTLIKAASGRRGLSRPRRASGRGWGGVGG